VAISKQRWVTKVAPLLWLAVVLDQPQRWATRVAVQCSLVLLSVQPKRWEIRVALLLRLVVAPKASLAMRVVPRRELVVLSKQQQSLATELH
jgi:hypothetical protein